MAIWGAIGQIIGGMVGGGGGGEGKSGQGMGMLMSGLQAGANQSQQENPNKQSAQQALVEMMKKKDTGFYGHKTVGSCRKKVNIIGRGD